MRCAVVIAAPWMALATVLLGLVAPARASDLTLLTPLARDCFSRQLIPACDQALVQAEVVQQRAAELDRYPCQTVLLGLQADVVMVQLRSGRGAKAFESLSAVQQRCNGL